MEEKNKEFLAIRLNPSERATLEFLSIRRAMKISELVRTLLREEAAREGVVVGFAPLYRDIEKGQRNG